MFATAGALPAADAALAAGCVGVPETALAEAVAEEAAGGAEAAGAGMAGLAALATATTDAAVLAAAIGAVAVPGLTELMAEAAMAGGADAAGALAPALADVAGAAAFGALAALPIATVGPREAEAGDAAPAAAALSWRRDNSLIFLDNSATRSFSSLPWRAWAIWASGAAPLTDPLERVSLSGEAVAVFRSSMLG